MVLSLFFVAVVKHYPWVFSIMGQVVTTFSLAQLHVQGSMAHRTSSKVSWRCPTAYSAISSSLLRLICRHRTQQEGLPRHISSCGPTANMRAQLLSKGKLLLCRIHNHLWEFSHTFSKGKQTIQQAVHQHEGERGDEPVIPICYIH